MESVLLAWRFLLEYPATPYLLPLPWHLLAVLIVLGVLSAIGLHHLLGWTLKLYHIPSSSPSSSPSSTAPWLAWPGLVALLGTLQVLLFGYLLALLAPEMVRISLHAVEQNSMERIGAVLLAPAFAPASSATATKTPAGSPSGEPAPEPNTETSAKNTSPRWERAALNQNLHAYPPGALQERFKQKLAQAAHETFSLLSLLALQWAAQAHVHWPPQKAPLPTGELDALGVAQQPHLLAKHLLSLVREIHGEAALPLVDWQHVAGRRFMERVLEPWLIWQLRWLGAVLGLLVLLADGLLLMLLVQLKRMVQKPLASPPSLRS